MKIKLLLLSILFCCSNCIYSAFSDIKNAISYNEIINSTVNIEAKRLYMSYQIDFIIQSVFDIFILFVLIGSFVSIAKKSQKSSSNSNTFSLSKTILAILIFGINLGASISALVLVSKNIQHYFTPEGFLSWFVLVVPLAGCVFPAMYISEKRQDVKHAIRYTYEEYKAKMDAKKAEIKEKKLQSKKERLRKELEEMEKAE